MLDVLVCNWIGIELGMKLCHVLEMKKYSWRSVYRIKSVKGKLKRAALQFSPYSFTEFRWDYTGSLRRWLGMLAMIFCFLLAEVNAFYMKAVLWVPSSHWINFVRAVVVVSRCGQQRAWSGEGVPVSVSTVLDPPVPSTPLLRAWMSFCVAVCDGRGCGDARDL